MTDHSGSQEAPPTRPEEIVVSIVLLAAGKASRMGPGGPHKLLAEFDGIPLIRRAAMTALGTSAVSVTVVTGHRHAEIGEALEGLALERAHNPDYALGMASSLVTGFLSEQRRHADGILVMHADMPAITTADLEILMAAFRQASGKAVVRAAAGGKRGNPVILPNFLFGKVLRLQGDIGARHLIEASEAPVIDVDIGPGALLDVDTPEAVVAAGGILTT